MYIREARRAGGGVAIWGVACGGGDGGNSVRTNHRQCGGIGSIAAIGVRGGIVAIVVIGAIVVIVAIVAIVAIVVIVVIVVIGAIVVILLLLGGGVHIGCNILDAVVFAARADAHPRRIHTRKRIVKGGQQAFHSVFIRISITALAV